MRRYLFIIIIICSILYVYPQSIDMNVKSYMSYFHNHETNYITELTLTNLSSDTLIVWIVDSLKKDNEQQNIYDYFFTKNGDVSLSEIIYDGNVSDVSINIGTTFIKELPPRSTFTIFFIDNCEQNDDYYNKFAKNNIVSVKKSTLTPFHFTSFPIWQQLLFQNDNIILSHR